MSHLLNILPFLMVTIISFGQKTFEVSGTFIGEHKNKVYLFFENDFAHSDSLTATNLVDTKIFKNEYVLIDVWASWCKPCRALTPALKKLYSTYKDRGFKIISVSIDNNKEAWKRAIVEDGLQWTQLDNSTGVDGILCKYYDIREIPTQILIDKEGKVISFPSSIGEIDKLLKAKL